MKSKRNWDLNIQNEFTDNKLVGMKIAAYIRNIFELCEQEKFLLLPKKGYPSINNWSIFLLDIFIYSTHYL